MEAIQDKRRAFPAEDVYTWWWEMQPANEGAGQPKHRGELAELRRCKSLSEVLLVPRFQVLRWKFQAAGYGAIPAVAAVAGVLAHVAQDTNEPFGTYLAQPKPKGSGPKLSELRLRRLIRIKSRDELFASLIRVLALAGGTAPVRQLAEDIWYWNDRTRRDWAFAYYDALGEKY